MIPGPVGYLEAITSCPESDRDPPATAVVCHPHPQHGGTMQNKVVHTLARAFDLAGARTVRFNFRGVGQSEGDSTGETAIATSLTRGPRLLPVGETEDALAVLRWVRGRRPDDELWLAGFSFGASVALRAATRFPVSRLITVAPAVHLYDDLADLEPPAVPWLLVMGTADEVVPATVVQDWAGSRRHPPTTVLHEGAGHFYHQRLPDLRESVLHFLAANS